MDLKKLIFYAILWLIIIVTTGCATYNAKKDPAYQAYLRGEISYAEYIEHYDRLVTAQYQQRQAIAAGFQDFSRSMKESSDRRYRERQTERQTRAIEDIGSELRKANRGY